MSKLSELMIRFKRGVSEKEAKKVISSVGAKVRRRMRWDNDDEVLLLVQVDGDVDELASRLKSEDSVADTEVNADTYRPMD